MIELLRLFKGYIRFIAEGGFAERFLNLCKINGVNLWNVENDGENVKACTTIHEFAKLKIPAQNSGMEIKILKNCGLPFVAKRHKWRAGVLAGIILTVLFIWYMSGFVWNVEIIEEKGCKIENLEKSVYEEGVKTGARKSEIDILQVQENLLEQFPELSWISVNIFGSKAQVEYTIAKENTPITDESIPKNIVAEKSGQIVLIEGYKGTNMVKKGEFVAQGSLLISGVVTNGDLTEELVRAKGKVFATTENEIVKKHNEKIDTEIVEFSKSRYIFYLFGLKIPFGINHESDLMSTTDIFLIGNDTVLPVGFIREDNLRVTDKNVSLNKNERILLGLCESVEEKRNEYSQTEIEKTRCSVKNFEAETEVKLYIKCVEDISMEGGFHVTILNFFRQYDNA